MTTYAVQKPFNTVNRRLAAGATFDSDVDPIEPFDLSERVQNGFLKSPDATAPVQPAVPPVNQLGISSTPEPKADETK